MIQILVKPGSKIGPKIVESDDGLIVYLREKAIGGAANAALFSALAKHFKIPKSQIRIVRGHRARRKFIILAPVR